MGPRFEKIHCSTMSSASTDNGRLYQLEQVLITRLPESVHMLNLCRIAIKERFPKTAQVQFYGYVEDDDDDGAKSWQNGKDSFIVCIERPNLHAKKGIIVLPPSNVNPLPKKMVQALDSVIGWEEPNVFQTIPQSLWSIIKELCIAHKNLKPENNEGIPGILLAISDIQKGKELEVSCESNITLRQLEQKHVPEIVENWKWAQEHSEREIRETLKVLISCGAFNEDGEMVSSVLLNPLGTFNVLYTPEKFRRRGYGQLVMRWVSKQTAKELEIHPLAEVEVWNDASKAMLEKVGYGDAYRTKWFYFTPSS